MTPTNEALEAKRAHFFAVLAKTGQPSRAAAEAGMDRSSTYKLRKSNPEFAERWDAALDNYCDILEAEAHRRAVEGTEKGVWHQGIQVGTERQYSDSILLAMLKAKRREYRDNSKVELTGPDGGPIAVEENPVAVARKLAFALALGLRAAKNAPIVDDGSDLV